MESRSIKTISKKEHYAILSVALTILAIVALLIGNLPLATAIMVGGGFMSYIFIPDLFKR